MPGVIKDLLERHSENGASFDSRHSDFAHHISVLASLEDAGCIKQQARDARYSTWKLTPDGYATIKPGFHLHDPTRSLIERKGIVLAERSIWELVVLLDQSSWRHIVKPKSKHDAPYTPSEPATKVWYSSVGDTAICHAYLHALAIGDKEVLHWQSAGYYESVISGVPHVSIRARKLKVAQYDEDDWGATAEVLVKPRRPRQARQAAVPMLDYAGSDFQEEDHRPLSDDDDACSSSSAHAAASSSSSDSSSDSSKSNSSSSTSEKSAANTPPATTAGGLPPAGSKEDPAVAEVLRAANPSDGIEFGLCYATRTYNDDGPVGWEMNCYHPLHQTPRCRKRLQGITRDRTQETTAKMLKAWAAMGIDKLTQSEHKDVWSDVEKLHADGMLLEHEPVVAFLGPDGQVLPMRKRKRAA
jgi:hypothetical protein